MIGQSWTGLPPPNHIVDLPEPSNTQAYASRALDPDAPPPVSQLRVARSHNHSQVRFSDPRLSPVDLRPSGTQDADDLWPGSSQSSSGSSLTSASEAHRPDFTESSLSSYSSIMSCEETTAEHCARCATPTADHLPQTQQAGEHATGSFGQRRTLRKEDTLMSIDSPTLANSIAEEVQSQLEPRLVGLLVEMQNKIISEMQNKQAGLLLDKQAGLLRIVADAISVQVREEHAETRQEVAMLRQEVLSLRMQIERLRTGR